MTFQSRYIDSDETCICAVIDLLPFEVSNPIFKQSRKLNRDQAGKGWFSEMSGIRDG